MILKKSKLSIANIELYAGVQCDTVESNGSTKRTESHSTNEQVKR